MSFLLLMIALSALACVLHFLLGDRKDYRMAMRHGMAGGFILTGIDHFVSGHSRYVPMLPDLVGDHALELVYWSGALELAGAIGLAVMLAFLVMANIHVALEGGRVQGLEFGIWYDYLRPFFQPIFMLWALFVSGVIWKGAYR